MKYVDVYKVLIRKSYICINPIHILSTGYLLISLKPQSQLNNMITQVGKVVTKTNPKYNLLIKRLHLYYDMKLVTLATDYNLHIIIQFPVFVPPHSQLPLTLYEIEFVPVPIKDQNIHANSYTGISNFKAIYSPL